MGTNDKVSILVVDDEEIILVALKESFSKYNYNVLASADPKEALRFLREESFAVIICDQRMGEITGLDFFQECKKIQPDASRVLITGVLTLQTVIDAVNQAEIFRFVAKPWIREELLATIDSAAQRYQLILDNRKLHDESAALTNQLIAQNKKLKDKLEKFESQESKSAATGGGQ